MELVHLEGMLAKKVRAAPAVEPGGLEPPIAQDPKAIVRRYYEQAWNTGELAEVDELVVTAYRPGGPEGEKRLITGARAAFPDLRFTIDDLLLAERDTVVVRWTAQGTQRGRFAGLAPTGRRATWSGITLYRLEGNQLVAGWSRSDRLGLLQQLGANVP